SPDSLDFGDQEVQTRSKQLKIALTNNAGRPVEIRGVDTSGAHWVDFEADYDECTGEAVAAGKRWRIGVIFRPQAAGTRNAFLLITYDDPDHPQKIPIRGNGIKPKNEAGPTKTNLPQSSSPTPISPEQEGQRK